MHPDKVQQAKELNDAYSQELLKNAVTSGFFSGAFLFERMNFIERFIIKKISKATNTVQKIDWDAIWGFIDKLNS